MPDHAADSNAPRPIDVGRMAGLWTRAQPVVASFIRSMVHNFHDAEDVLQETAYTVAIRFEDFVSTDQNDRPFVAWVMRIARLKVYEHWRKTGRDKNRLTAAALEELAQDFEREGVEEPVLDYVLHQCLDQLPARPRRLLELRYSHDHKPREIAKHAGLTPNAVRIALSRTRAAIAKCIETRLAKEYFG